MKKIGCLMTVFTLVLMYICGCANNERLKKVDLHQPFSGEAAIHQSWQGDYLLDLLHRLPEDQRQQSVGFIGDAETFKAVWKAFEPAEAVPDIDFKTNLVLFARNTQFYNRIRIGKVNVTNGVAEVLAMETMSAMPIEDKVAMSMVVVGRQGITAIQSNDKIIQINKTK